MRTMTQAKRVQDAVKRTGKGRQSVSIAESFREKDLRREIHTIWAPSCAVIRFIRADTSFWKDREAQRRCDCSQNRSWRVADLVTQTEIPELNTMD